MKFWKEHEKMRLICIAVLFIIGLILVFGGWKMTGMMQGLLIMIAGVIFLLTALLIYNKPFEKQKK